MLSRRQHWSLSTPSAPRLSKAGGELVLALLEPVEDSNQERSCSQPAPPVFCSLKTFLDQLGRTAMLLPKSLIRVSLSTPSWFVWSVISPHIGIQFCMGVHTVAMGRPPHRHSPEHFPFPQGTEKQVKWLRSHREHAVNKDTTLPTKP